MVIRMKKIENPYVQYMYSYPHKTAYRALSNISIKEYLPKLIGGDNSLYFHIPFCQYKCGYCNLFSVAGQSEQWMESYVNAMEQQAVQLKSVMPEGVSFQDLTLGGGTPLILPEDLLRKVFFIAREYLGFEKEGNSIIVETSPNQTTKEKLKLLKEEGVSRVSIGVQSFVEEELLKLNRFHKVNIARKALESIREMDFACMNLDLIYGIPGQTMDSLQYSLEQALQYEPEEIFIYPLYVKPDTYLYQQGAKRAVNTYEMHKMVRQLLQDAGYTPHSMRRFVRNENRVKRIKTNKGHTLHSIGVGKKNEKVVHDTKQEAALQLPESLCGFGNTISIGCGGRSYIGDLHFCTPYAVKQEKCLAVMKEYMEREDYLQVSHGFVLSKEEQKRRYAIKHVLFGKGINQKDYQGNFSTNVLEDFPVIKEWEQNGYVVIQNEYITLTEEGFGLSDYLGPQLISETVRRKCEAYYNDSL